MIFKKISQWYAICMLQGTSSGARSLVPFDRFTASCSQDKLTVCGTLNDCQKLSW